MVIGSSDMVMANVNVNLTVIVTKSAAKAILQSKGIQNITKNVNHA